MRVRLGKGQQGKVKTKFSARVFVRSSLTRMMSSLPTESIYYLQRVIVEMLTKLKKIC